ncbi:minor tail protein [Gordonia phage GodonK]|uniref:Minor tail protein n=1 Tax=Gordonia phage GodonK TaxID=2562192 RepID=A0A4D6E214_9CAUD|nr:minor tail protein [Gordonia phage GodonK]QBZ72710.1 minor tail protein [Gordonia phage GodonK]
MSDWQMKTRPEPRAKKKKRIRLPAYTMPHRYLPLVRGVPMRDHNQPTTASTKLPPMSLPIEAQNSLAYHLEMAGLVHVEDLKKLADENGMIHVDQLPPVYLVHLAPEHGPDIQLNPGTWVTPEEAAAHAVVSPPVTEVELPKTEEIADASYEQLAALEATARAARIQRIREQQVDAFVEPNPAPPGDNDSVDVSRVPGVVDDQEQGTGQVPSD